VGEVRCDESPGLSSDCDDPEPAYDGGVLAKYGAAFSSAADGAVTDPGLDRNLSGDGI